MSDDKTATLPDELIVAAMGAVLFASGEPVHPREIGDSFPDMAPAEVESAFQALEKELDHSRVGLRLERVAGGFRLATRPEVAALVRTFFRQRHRTRLSPASLETLAMVAYRQPITAPEIQAIRGKDSSASLKNLLDKKLIRILGRKKVVGSPWLYGTSREFLVHFGLDSLEDLPAIEDFDTLLGALDATDDLSKESDEGTPPIDGESVEDEERALGVATEAAASDNEVP